PLAGAFGGTGPGPRTGGQAGQDLGEEAEVTVLAFDPLDRDVHRLRAADRRALAGLAPDQSGLLEPAQVRAERGWVQGKPRRELPDRDRTAREPEVPVQPEPRVVGERLVDLERCRLTAGHGRLLAIGGAGARGAPRAAGGPRGERREG